MCASCSCYLGMTQHRACPEMRQAVGTHVPACMHIHVTGLQKPYVDHVIQDLRVDAVKLTDLVGVSGCGSFIHCLLLSAANMPLPISVGSLSI